MAEVIQSMVGEAGFDMKVQPLEANTMVSSMNAGDYNAAVATWSGRADPDANIALFLACDGFQNWGKYCDPAFDALLNKARESTDPAARQTLYWQVAAQYLTARPDIFLFHTTWLFAASDKLKGFVPTPEWPDSSARDKFPMRWALCSAGRRGRMTLRLSALLHQIGFPNSGRPVTRGRRRPRSPPPRRGTNLRGSAG